MINLSKYTHLIATSTSRDTLISKKYNTRGIMNAILQENKRAYLDVQFFAQAIPSNSLYELSYSLWHFLKQKVEYLEDGMSFQAIKSPARLWADQSGDCKSLTLFSAAVLKALDIPYSIRFVSYSEYADVFTHVYLVAHGKNADYIIDPVWKGKFNTEAKFTFKKDYKMTGLYSMGATSQRARRKSRTSQSEQRNSRSARRKGILSLPNDFTEAGFDAAIIRQRLEIERNIMLRNKRIGKVDEYDASLDILDEFIGALDNDDHETMDMIISGIGRNGRGRRWLKRLKEKAKKKIKTLVKIATLPQRLVTKGILELVLPVIAPMFMYLFITDRNLLAKLPSAVQRKLKNQKRIADFIVNAIGMKRTHFMGIIRNGVMKKYHKSPEKILAEQFKGISGIGWVAIAASLIPKVINLISKLIKMFKKKGGAGLSDAVKDMAMSPNDMAEMTPAVKAQAGKELLRKDHYQTQPGRTVEALAPDDVIPADGGKSGARGICG